MAMGHPADDKRCGDRSDSAILSFLPGFSWAGNTASDSVEVHVALLKELNLLFDCVLIFQ